MKTILQFAKEYRVGHIVIGAPGRKPSLWKRLRGEGGVVERLVAQTTGATVVVLDTKGVAKAQVSAEIAPPPEGIRKGSRGEGRTLSKKTSPRFDVRAMMWDKRANKVEVIRQLLDACCSDAPEIQKEALSAILEREKQGGTFMGEDVAIPHARLEGLDRPLVVLGVGKSGIYDEESGRSVKIVFLLLSPAGNRECHVETLGKISRMASDDQWRKQVLGAANPREIVRIVDEWEKGTTRGQKEGLTGGPFCV